MKHWTRQAIETIHNVEPGHDDAKWKEMSYLIQQQKLDEDLQNKAIQLHFDEGTRQFLEETQPSSSSLNFILN